MLRLYPGGADAQCLDHVNKVEIVTHLHETSIYWPSRLSVGLMRLLSDSITMTDIQPLNSMVGLLTVYQLCQSQLDGITSHCRSRHSGDY
jgi:hypothetical protein